MVYDEHLDKWKVETIKALPSPTTSLIQILPFESTIIQHCFFLSPPHFRLKSVSSDMFILDIIPHRHHPRSGKQRKHDSRPSSPISLSITFILSLSHFLPNLVLLQGSISFLPPIPFLKHPIQTPSNQIRR